MPRLNNILLLIKREEQCDETPLEIRGRAAAVVRCWRRMLGQWHQEYREHGANSSAEGSNAPAEKEGPIEITFAASTWDIPSEDNNFVQKYLEEKYNVKIINMRVTDENFKLKIAANEVPDIFPHTPTEVDMVNWARQGVIASISVDEIKEYMPSYIADVESVDPNAWDIGLVDGKNYGIPRVWLNGSTGFIPTYNNNWLKAIGYSEPPKTLEEFEDVFTKFRNNDPDGNSQKDTYGMSGRGKNARNELFNPVYAAFASTLSFTEAADGTIAWGGIMANRSKRPSS